MLQCKEIESEKLNCGNTLKKMFIASPVNVDTCKKVKQQDVEALSCHKISVEEIATLEPCYILRAWKLKSLTVTYCQNRSS